MRFIRDAKDRDLLDLRKLRHAFRRMLVTAALDVDRFRKVQALARDGATVGERAAAAAHMNDMARRAGLSVEDAIRRCGAPAKADPAKEAEQAARRQWQSMRSNPKKVARRSRLVDLYGSEEKAAKAIFADTPHEAALRQAVEPSRVRKATTGWPIGSMMGWNGGVISKLTPSILDAIQRAFPMPATVRGVWAEYCEWRDLESDRDSINPYYEDPDFVRARMGLLEARLDNLPATSSDDVLARLDWMAHIHADGPYRDVHDDMAWIATLRADVMRFMPSAQHGAVQTGRADAANGVAPEGIQTGRAADPLRASDRRRALLSVLDTVEGAALSDREIARRFGVSPSTVGKLRRGWP